MDKKVMNDYIDEFIASYEQNHKYDAPMKIEGVRKLMGEETPYSFKNQQAYEDPEFLQYNLCHSVQDIKRNKDGAIEVYKLFLEFLKNKGISADVEFPPIPVSNSFERLMFISKYFHEPGRKISKLPEILWIDPKTVKNDLKKLMGQDNDPLQVCGEVFVIPEIDDQNDTLTFESTAHPLFLTPNITQLIVTLKGLKEMSESPLYGYSAKTAAVNIWAQLSNYAKRRIPEVLEELMAEDPSWYESLENADKNLYHTERACSVNTEIIFYSLKNIEETYFLEMQDGEKKHLYKKCRTTHYDSESFTIISDEGKKTLSRKNVIQAAHTLDGIY